MKACFLTFPARGATSTYSSNVGKHASHFCSAAPIEFVLLMLLRGYVIEFVYAHFCSHGLGQVRVNCRQRVYFNDKNADMAFTEDFNTPVRVHVNVTSYICLTVYADLSACACCTRVSIEFIIYNATKKRRLLSCKRQRSFISHATNQIKLLHQLLNQPITELKPIRTLKL